MIPSAITEEPDERKLIERARHDLEAFGVLYDLYVKRVYTYFRYRVNQVSTAEDLTAQTFEQALISLARYDSDKAPFRAWLFGIAHHTVSAYYRKQKRWRQIPLDAVYEQTSHCNTPEYIAIQNERHVQLADALATLPTREREVLALKFGGDLHNRQIAEIMDLSESNVGVIIYRSIKQLRRLLHD